MVDKHANVLSLQIIAMWMTKIREPNRRKTRRPPSGVCWRHVRYTYVHSHKNCILCPKLSPYWHSAVHYWPYITAAQWALSRTHFFRVFLHFAVHFELSAFERGCDIGLDAQTIKTPKLPRLMTQSILYVIGHSLMLHYLASASLALHLFNEPDYT